MRRLALLITSLGALAAPPFAPAAIETLVLRSQPFPMKPYQVVQGMTAVPSPRVDGYVVGMTVEVVDMAGRVQTMNDVMLHHAVFVKALVTDYTCGRFYDYDRRPSPLPAERFFGAGEEHMELHLPTGYGYPNRGKIKLTEPLLAAVKALNLGRAKIHAVSLGDEPHDLLPELARQNGGRYVARPFPK